MTAAFKMVLLLRSHEDLPVEEFTRAWSDLDTTVPLDAPGLIDAVFDAPTTETPPIENVAAAPFDAAVETWWERKNDAADWVVSAGFGARWLEPRLRLLAGIPTAIGGAPQALWASPDATPAEAVKVLTLPVAPRRLSFADFAEHWTGTHARLALDGPGTRDRLLRMENTPAPLSLSSRLGQGRFDGVGALTFASMDALAEEFRSDYYHRVLAPDEVRFTNPEFSVALVTREMARATR